MIMKRFSKKQEQTKNTKTAKRRWPYKFTIFLGDVVEKKKAKQTKGAGEYNSSLVVRNVGPLLGLKLPGL